jgi:hypothetical protein
MEWGWTSYNATGWVIEGRKQYYGRFQEFDCLNPAISRITFLAQKPVLAMREIVNQLNEGIDSLSLVNTIIN